MEKRIKSDFFPNWIRVLALYEFQCIIWENIIIYKYIILEKGVSTLLNRNLIKQT